MAPPAITTGLTWDRVRSAFGQTITIARLSVKAIYCFRNMNVTFSNGKVSNVE
jgi:hypothetical protein